MQAAGVMLTGSLLGILRLAAGAEAMRQVPLVSLYPGKQVVQSPVVALNSLQRGDTCWHYPFFTTNLREHSRQTFPSDLLQLAIGLGGMRHSELISW